jgi:hypothetical protein
MKSLRIGTFNTQNRFERAKVLNLADESNKAIILWSISAPKVP